MPSITINGTACPFQPGQTVLQAANARGLSIPQYCYHDGLSIVASCRICLGEATVPDPRTGKHVPYMGGKLFPTCQTTCVEGMAVYTNSPKAVANQKAVMEYLLINHPLDCPVCDQSGECFLQDYSYQYGRGVSRFEEQKVKNPKKDVGPSVLLYSDRCIMCTRCVRFTREVTGTGELMVAGRGNKEEIDVFPGVPLANELSANVIDLCPVGALLDKDFLFAQRVWFLKETPSIDPLTASGDNITIHHNEGKVYRVKPRENPRINRWWITDEVRYGWKFVHSEHRLRTPLRRQFGQQIESDYTRAYDDALGGIKKVVASGKRLLVMVSPMLTCEEAYVLAKLAMLLDPEAVLCLGPVPRHGEDKVYPIGAKSTDPNAFRICAEKAPNARGVRRVLNAFNSVLEYPDAVKALGLAGFRGGIGAAIITGNYPSPWATPELLAAVRNKFLVLIDTLDSPLVGEADVVLPGATFAEKAGTYESVSGILQAFEQAIPVIELAKSEGQIALDLIAVLAGVAPPATTARELVLSTTPGQVAAGVRVASPRARAFDAGEIRADMAREVQSLGVFADGVSLPPKTGGRATDMETVTL
jgi:NADH-quinone oxidoreductase subunit G